MDANFNRSNIFQKLNRTAASSVSRTTISKIVLRKFESLNGSSNLKSKNHFEFPEWYCCDPQKNNNIKIIKLNPTQSKPDSRHKPINQTVNKHLLTTSPSTETSKKHLYKANLPFRDDPQPHRQPQPRRAGTMIRAGAPLSSSV